MKITKAEKLKALIVMVVIDIVMILLFIPIHGHIVRNAAQKQSTIQEAISLNNKKDFLYSMKTEQGNFIAHTKIKAESPKKFREMNNDFLQVKRTREEYTEHTEAYTDSKGNSHTRVYWSWDYDGSKTLKSKYVSIYGHKFKLSLFNPHGYWKELDTQKGLHKELNSSGRYYQVDWDTRYKYDVVPKIVSSTFLGYFGQNGLTPGSTQNSINLSHKSINQIKKDNEGLSTRSSMVSIMVFILLMAIVDLPFIETLFDIG